MKPEEKIIPEQEKGAKTDVQTLVTSLSDEEACIIFNRARDKLIDINNWNNIAALPSATFNLTDSKGNPVYRRPEKGDLIKIDLPAPGSSEGQGFDWVVIEAIEYTKPNEEEELFAIRVRPSENPLTENPETAHFYTNEATSSFVVHRKGREVRAEVHGRNEKPNVNSKELIDKVRNTVIAATAMSGLANVQWKSLIDGLLKPDK